MTLSLPSSPWSVTASPLDREELAKFWLSAPSDQLEFLWNSPIGQATVKLVNELSSNTVFSADQIAFRNSVGQHLQSNFQSPLTPQLLLAVFLFSPRDLFKIANSEASLPPWLSIVYKNLYESPTPPLPSSTQPVVTTSDLPRPDFGPFPSSIEALVDNRIHLNRLLGLSNLYYIDPDDSEITAELIELRSHLTRCIEQCPEHLLQGFWASDLGDRYWALVRSGIQSEPLTTSDEQIKQTVTHKLQPSNGGGFGTPGSTNAFLIAMLYFLPGTMQIDDPVAKVPSWLFDNYKQIFMQPLNS